MEYIGFAVFAVVVIGGVILITRLMGRTKRNEGGDHGGGIGGAGAAGMGE